MPSIVRGVRRDILDCDIWIEVHLGCTKSKAFEFRNDAVNFNSCLSIKFIRVNILINCSFDSWCNHRLRVAQTKSLDEHLSMSGVCFIKETSFINSDNAVQHAHFL